MRHCSAGWQLQGRKCSGNIKSSWWAGTSCQRLEESVSRMRGIGCNPGCTSPGSGYVEFVERWEVAANHLFIREASPAGICWAFMVRKQLFCSHLNSWVMVVPRKQKDSREVTGVPQMMTGWDDTLLTETQTLVLFFNMTRIVSLLIKTASQVERWTLL